MDGGGLPTVDLDLTATGDLEGLRVQRLNAEVIGGEPLTTGTFAWERVPRWDLMLVAAGLDPGRYLADWPGRIDGRVRIDGEIAAESDGGLGLRVGVEELAGRLRDQPFTARGRLALAGGDIRAEGLQVASGPNRVFVDGRAGERLDLTFDIDAPDLAAHTHPAKRPLNGAFERSGNLGNTKFRGIFALDRGIDEIGHLASLVEWTDTA